MLTKEDLLAIAQMLEPIKGGLTRLEDQLGSVEGRLGNVESRLGSVEGRLGNVESRLGNVEGRLGNVEDRTQKIQERTTKLEVTIENQVDRAIKLLGEGHESLKQMIEGRLVTKEQQEDSEARIFALEEVSKRHTAQIEELQKKTG